MVSIVRQRFCASLSKETHDDQAETVFPFDCVVLRLRIGAGRPDRSLCELVSLNTSPKARVCSKDTKVGQAVTAVLEGPATIGGTVFPKGTALVGRVVDVTKHSKETPDDRSPSFSIRRGRKSALLSPYWQVSSRSSRRRTLLLAQRTDVPSTQAGLGGQQMGRG